MNNICVYTDGSCDPRTRKGAWAAAVIHGEECVYLSGSANDTTHQRMELTAVIEAVEYIKACEVTGLTVTIITDSQYVMGLQERKQKLISSGFKTRKNHVIRNQELLQKHFEQMDAMQIAYEKVKAHQKESVLSHFNRKVDKLARKIVRKNSVEK